MTVPKCLDKIKRDLENLNLFWLEKQNGYSLFKFRHHFPVHVSALGVLGDRHSHRDRNLDSFSLDTQGQFI
jgi:hypothetical protein